MELFQKELVISINMTLLWSFAKRADIEHAEFCPAHQIAG
jgi:hypothetical protein